MHLFLRSFSHAAAFFFSFLFASFSLFFSHFSALFCFDPSLYLSVYLSFAALVSGDRASLASDSDSYANRERESGAEEALRSVHVRTRRYAVMDTWSNWVFIRHVMRLNDFDWFALRVTVHVQRYVVNQWSSHDWIEISNSFYRNYNNSWDFRNLRYRNALFERIN